MGRRTALVAVGIAVTGLVVGCSEPQQRGGAASTTAAIVTTTSAAGGSASATTTTVAADAPTSEAAAGGDTTTTAPDGPSMLGEPGTAGRLAAAVADGDACEVQRLVNHDETPVADPVAFPAAMATSADAAAAVAPAAPVEVKASWDEWAAGLRRAADALASGGVTPEVLRRITNDDAFAAASVAVAAWADERCERDG